MHDRPEIISLLGIPYYAEPAAGEALEKLQKELNEAEEALKTAPDDPEAKVMLGRRLAYLWRYHESIASYTHSLAGHPDFAPLYRHRGHRYISIRRFGPASRDLARANQLQPNDFDILYHLGLARWLQGDYQGAKKAYEAYLPLCENDDQRVPLSYWLYSTLRRLGLDAEAAEILANLGDDLDIKDDSIYYFNIMRLFRAELTEEDIFELMKENDLAAGTIGYGLGLWHLFSDRKEAANLAFQAVLKGKYWPAFGFIAAEVEIARLEGLLSS